MTMKSFNCALILGACFLASGCTTKAVPEPSEKIGPRETRRSPCACTEIREMDGIYDVDAGISQS